jgi:hypothetical protein
MLCGSTTGGIPGSTSIAGAAGVDSVTSGVAKLTTPDDIVDIPEESIALSAVDAMESAGLLASTALSTDPVSDVPRVPAADPSEWEHPATRKADTKNTDTACRRLIDLLARARPHLRH